ncbi:ExbD/TolR family protein [Xylophilus sp.]|uniref:ExbD/TolR family protein n=1 Tax=Xylophilus sp. TaxID=2653893 RepID=UPI0013BA0554|nr:biopolymer transporter ExbD [Xylophilus sp.]KAF1044866.1 MAG: Biopolymer transport protein ExbD [Xylophilus sp.]
MAFGGFGGSGGGGSGRPMSDINVTPLVDVMLVLVVIFILTAPLLASAIRLDLPRSVAAAPGEPPRALRLAVDAAGRAYVDDVPVDGPALAARLAEAAARDPATEVQLRADAAVPYGRIVEVMGAAQRAGLSRVGFVADPQAAGK